MPEMPPVPREQVARSLPFEFTGLDYFGPLYIKLFVQLSNEATETASKSMGLSIYLPSCASCSSRGC